MNGLVNIFDVLRPRRDAVDALALAVDVAMAPLAGPVHRCGDWCRPYDGPIVQGRRDADGRPLEPVTEGRPG